jgi:LmbE family N-acetylglucosaminyl deacetylase
MSNSILVVAAHPDDEALGCGGTIAKHVSNGDIVTVAFMTNGVSARNNDTDVNQIARKTAADLALNILGVTNTCYFDYPDNALDTVPLINIAKTIESVVSKYHPNIIYTHFSEDLNVDHRLTHQAVMTACRPQAWCCVKQIFCFEVLSSTEWNSYSKSKFNPNKFVNIEQFWLQKKSALEAYHEEMRPHPHSRSMEAVEALAVLRGSVVGLKKAESFQIERIIE